MLQPLPATINPSDSDHLDALVEGELGFPGAVDVGVLLRLHPTVFVIQDRLNDPVTDGLYISNFKLALNELGVEDF